MAPIEKHDWRCGHSGLRFESAAIARRTRIEAMERYQLILDDQGRLDRNVASGGMWLRVGTVAAFAVVGGLVSVFNGDAPPAQAAAIALGGAAICVLAWRRAWTKLNAADAPPSNAPSASRIQRNSQPEAAY
jgi:hypothetical protein